MTVIARPTFKAFLELFPVSDHSEIKRFARVELGLTELTNKTELAPGTVACLGLERWFRSAVPTMPATHAQDIIRTMETAITTHFDEAEKSENDVIGGFAITIADEDFVAWTGIGDAFYKPSEGIFDLPEAPPISTLTIYVDMFLHRLLRSCTGSRELPDDAPINPEDTTTRDAD